MDFVFPITSEEKNLLITQKIAEKLLIKFLIFTSLFFLEKGLDKYTSK